MPKAQSKTKDHFETIDDANQKMRCKICFTVLSTGGGTSNMLSHLRRTHSDALTLSESGTSSSSTKNVVNGNTTQDKIFTTDFKKADHALTLMLATDFQPFSIVHDKGFRNFIETINPTYKIPDKRVLRYNLMPKLYFEGKAKLKSILAEVDHISLTSDIWTSNMMESYITITVHFFHEKYLKSYVLTTKALKEAHTGDNLKEYVHGALTEWEIRNKVVCITTDNGPNVIKMARLLGIRSMPCFAHTLNLVIDDSIKIPELKTLIDKCKKIVKYFKQSNVATLSLQKEQKKRNPDVVPLSLVQDVPTRWNTLYYMIKRILKLIDSLAGVQRKLPQAPDIISPVEEDILKEIVLLLDVFEQATQTISGDQYPTSCLIIPIIYGLYDNLITLNLKITTSVGKMLLLNLKTSMGSRLCEYEQRTVCRISTVLHPTFRNSFRLLENKEAAKDAVKAEINNILRLRQTSQRTENTEESSLKSTDEKVGARLFGFLKNVNASNSDTPSATAINLLRIYSETNFSDINYNWDNVVAFWNFNKHLQPLDEIALKYLTVPATSVRSERVFSTTGYILNNRRCMLRSDAVEMLCFLNQNDSLLKNCETLNL